MTLRSQTDSLINELEKTLQYHVDSLGMDHIDIAMQCDRLGQMYLRVGQYPKADSLFNKALEIKSERLNNEHPDIAISYDNLGNTSMHLGDYENSKIFYNKSLEIRLNSLGEKHLEVAKSNHKLGNVFWRTGFYEQAERHYKRALEIRLDSLGKQHLDVAANYNSLGIIFYQTGDYENARSYYTEALSIRQELLDKSDPKLAESYNTLGIIYAELANYEKAINYWIQAKNINIKNENHLRAAYDYNNLGEFNNKLGNHKTAISYCNKALTSKLKILEPDHPKVASTYDILGMIYLKIDDIHKAINYFNKALNIRLKHFGEMNPIIASNYNNLGMAYQSDGNFHKAIDFFTKALNISIKEFNENHPSVAFAYNNLGKAYQEKGNYLKAISFFNKSLKINLERFDKKHPDIVYSYAELANTYENINAYETVDSLWQIVIPHTIQLLKSNYLFLSNEQRTKYSNILTPINTDFYSFATTKGTESIKQLATNFLLNTKSLALDYGISTNRLIREINDIALIKQYQELNKLNKQLADAETMVGDKSNEEDWDLLELQEQYDKLAFQMLQHPQLKNKLGTKTTEWQDIQNHLQQKEAAIDFLRVFDKNNAEWKYFGIIIRKNLASPQFVSLFDEKTLSSFLNNNKETPQHDYINDKYSREALHNVIWKPILPYLEGINTIHLSTAGILHRVPFESLQTDEGEYLAIKYKFHYYSALRDLFIEKPKNNNFEDIVLMGHILYDLDDKDKYEEQELSLFRGELRNGVRPLPKTLNEVVEIGRQATQAGLHTTLLTIDAATEDTLQYFMEARAPSILHFATHGVFLPPVKEDISEGLIGMRDRLRTADNPLQRSALMLYGANESWIKGSRIIGSSEDGILTAFEVTALDLQNTDMVVLSACSTGLGENHSTEGIFGLQRAFKLAGVENVIASLWNVSDVATKELMVLFYDYLLLQKQDPATALRNAKLNMKKNGAKPKNWAGFILIE